MSNPLYASAVQNFVLGMLPLKLFLAENYEIIFSSERGIEKTSTNNALHDLGVFFNQWDGLKARRWPFPRPKSP